MPQIAAVGPQERVLFLGQNGSGKSMLARAMLDVQPRYIVFDKKGDFPAREWDEIITRPDDKRLTRNPSDRMIYKAPAPYNGGAALDQLLGWQYRRAMERGKAEPFIVHVDEGYSISKTGHTRWLSALATEGRSLFVGLWVGSQRPRWIPTEVKSEAWRTYLFALGYAEDEEEAARLMKQGHGRPGVLAGLVLLRWTYANHHFVEIKRNPDEAGSKIITPYPPIAL